MEKENLEGLKEDLKTREALKNFDEKYSMDLKEWEEVERRHAEDLEFAERFIDAVKGGYELPNDPRIAYIFDDMPEMKKMHEKNKKMRSK